MLPIIIMGQTRSGCSKILMAAALFGLLLVTTMSSSIASPPKDHGTIEQRVEALLADMTLAEKIGQMNQVNGQCLRRGHAESS